MPLNPSERKAGEYFANNYNGSKNTAGIFFQIQHISMM